MVLMDPTVLKDRLEQSVHKVRKVQRELLELQGRPVLPEPQELQVLKDRKEIKVRKGQKVRKDQRGQQDLKERLVLLERLALQEQRELQVLKAKLGKLVQLVLKVQTVRKARRGM